MLIPVILSGGAGTRLWPLSRELYPKQFLPLVGERTMIQETALRTAGLAGRRGAHRRLQRGAPLPGRGTAARARHRAAGDPARARRAQHGACRRGRGAGGACRPCARQGQGRRPGPARAARGSRARGRRELRARRGDGPAGRPRGPPGDLRRRADAARDRLRLHPAGERRGRGAPGRRIRRETGCRAREGLRRERRLLLEQRHVPAAGPGLPGRTRPAGPGDARGLPQGLRGGRERPGFRAARQGRIRGLPGRFHRLRGDGEDEPRGRRAAVRGLERRRLLRGTARRAAAGCERQRHARRRRRRGREGLPPVSRPTAWSPRWASTGTS